MTEQIVALYAASGDLSGNWSWTVWLLIPPRSGTSERGVSTYLARRPTEEDAR